jgi:hypothetical protein
MVPLVGKLLAAGLALGLVAAAAKGVVSGPSSGSSPEMPPVLVDAIVNAIASRDVGVMRAVALKIGQAGYPAAADDLKRTADEIEAENSVRRAVAKVMPDVPETPVRSPGVGPVAPGTAASPEQVLASKLALNLHQTVPGRENKALVTEFQKQEGLVADGKYGPKTALALVKYGIVPAVPRAWPKGTEAAARAGFAAALRMQATADKTRGEEWLQMAALAE